MVTGISLSLCLPQMIYLRKFKNLRTLNLNGNPVCDSEQYSTFIAAYLPDLVYLDFRLLDDNMVSIVERPRSSFLRAHED